jgi:hypothetical protein
LETECPSGDWTAELYEPLVHIRNQFFAAGHGADASRPAVRFGVTLVPIGLDETLRICLRTPSNARIFGERAWVGEEIFMRRTAFKPSGEMRRRRWKIALIVAGIALLTAIPASAAPAPAGSMLHRAIPNWLSLEGASRLDVGIDVLVPDAVPAPFAGEPEITAYDGYYSLYWMIPGTPPTFLQITGEAGGTIPNYSKYDRNVQLEQNAAVGGTPAYHDLTPIYDLVFWQVDDVVYSVESENLAADDSLTLANSLSVLSTGTDAQPVASENATIDVPESVDAGDVIPIDIEGVSGARLTVDSGSFVGSGGDEVDAVAGNPVQWQAPATETDLTASFSLVDPEAGDAIASASTLVVAANAQTTQAGTLSLSCPDSVEAGSEITFTLSGSGKAIVDAAEGSFPAGSPDSDFSSDSGDSNTLVGTVPDSGSIDLVWTAPEVDSSKTVYLFASTETGETPGECDILVTAKSGGAGVSADQELGNAAGTTVTPETLAAAPTATDEAAPAPSATAKRAKPTKTPKAYNEVLGLPTALPLDDGTGGSGGRLAPTPTVHVTATARPTATFAPTTDGNGMMAQTIGPNGGSLASPLGITVVIPKGALNETVTLSIQPIGETKIPTASDVQLVGANGFEVAIAGSNGVAITDPLQRPAEVRIAVDKGTNASAQVYEVEGGRLIPLTNTRREQNELVISVTELSQYVAGVPVAATVSTKRHLLPFVLAAVVVLMVLLAMVVLGGIFRPRRQRIVVTRRPQRKTFR